MAMRVELLARRRYLLQQIDAVEGKIRRLGANCPSDLLGQREALWDKFDELRSLIGMERRAEI